jgi:hypothetical protein
LGEVLQLEEKLNKCKGELSEETDYMRDSLNRCITYDPASLTDDTTMLDVLVNQLRPRTIRDNGDKFGIFIPYHPRSMARLFMKGDPKIVLDSEIKDDPECIRDQKHPYTVTDDICWGWLNYSIETDNMYDDILWKTDIVIDMEADDDMWYNEFMDGFTFDHAEGRVSPKSMPDTRHLDDAKFIEYRVITPTGEHNEYSVRKTFMLYYRLLNEGRIHEDTFIGLRKELKVGLWSY